MGYTYVSEKPPRPFVPGRIEFAKKKAKALQQRIPELRLSECQQAVAQALGWPDWYTLDQEIKRGAAPSLPDEAVPEVEVRRRRFAQFSALQTVLNLQFTDAEEISAELGLTCSAATAKKRVADVGPWGAFQQPATEVAPGIFFGECAKFHCYRLSPERDAAMHPLCRVDAFDGWYMADDHGWRVELSFPDEFPGKTVKDAWDSARHNEPFIAELISRVAANHSGSASEFNPETSIQDLRAEAALHPDSWFAISCFHDWMFDQNFSDTKLTAVSAVQGRHLSACIDPARGRECGTWLETPVRWFVVSTSDLILCKSPQPIQMPALRLSGLNGWPSSQVAKSPVKRQIFSAFEVDFISGLGFDATVDRIRVTGAPSIID